MRNDVREIFTGSVCVFFGFLVTRWSVDPQSKVLGLVCTSKFYVTIFIFSCRWVNLANFFLLIYLLKS